VSEQKSVPQISYLLNLFADYYQIYLRDEEIKDDTPDDWGEQLMTQMIAVAAGITGVSTARNTHVPVHVALFDARPDDDFTWIT
jgi:hypothetical protein